MSIKSHYYPNNNYPHHNFSNSITLNNISHILGAGLQIKTDYFDKVMIIETSQMYPLKEEVWENWLPFAYHAFNSLINYTGIKIKSFASIGSSNGADAIGAILTFRNLEEIIITDIDSETIKTALLNVEAGALQCTSLPTFKTSPFNFVKKRKRQFDHFQIRSIGLTGLVGSVCYPIQEYKKKLDLIYENLPNLPQSETISKKDTYFSHFNTNNFPEITFSELEQQMLLQSHAVFLETAKNCLNPKGYVVCAIGGRIPYPIIERMFEERGYYCHLLTVGFKKQTEPEEVLQGYAKAEENNHTIFDFYYCNQSKVKTGIYKSEEILKFALQSYHISAKDALEIYQKLPSFEVGHIVYIIQAWLKQ